MKANPTWRRLRDPVRMGAQSAVGAVLAYLATSWAGLPASWAVISALFVAQQSLDATVTAAAGRLGGTVLGTLIGLGTVLLLPGADAVGWRITAAAVLMNGLAALVPATRFGVVAAAIIVLPSGDDIWQSALDRGLSIGVGTVVGTASALLVWPESAARRARRAVMRALAACRDLVAMEMDALVHDDAAALDRLHQRFLGAMHQARELAGQAKLHDAKGGDVRDLVEATSRLWHTLVILDRVQQDRRRRAKAAGDDAVSEAMAGARDRVCAMLSTDNGPARGEALARVRSAIDRAVAAVKASAEQTALDPLAFTLDELGQDLERLNGALAGRNRAAH